MRSEDKLCGFKSEIFWRTDPNHNLFGGGLDLLAQMPLCASRILFLPENKMEFSVSYNPAVKHIVKSILMCASLFALWYIVLVLINYYNPAFHLIATFSSAVMVGMGKSWGLIDSILK
jgi:hypothetical protein